MKCSVTSKKGKGSFGQLVLKVYIVAYIIITTYQVLDGTELSVLNVSASGLEYYQ